MKKMALALLALLFTGVSVFSANAQPPDIGGEQIYIQAPDNPGIPPGICSSISQILLGLSGNVTLVAGDTGQFNLPVGIILCKEIDFFVGNNDSRLTVGLGPASGPTGNGRFGPIELFEAIEASGGNGVYLRVQGMPGSQSVILTVIGDDTSDWVQLGGGDKELSLRLRLFDRALWTYNNTKYAADAASGWLFEDTNGNDKILSGDGDRAVRTPSTSGKNDDNALCIITPNDWTELITAAFESQDSLNPGISKWDFTNDPGFQAGDSAIPIASILIEPEGLMARFIATPLAGTAPLTVSFTDQSTGFPNSWFWNFGDGVTSAEQSPTHIYTTAGTYTVSLTVRSSAGSDTGTNVNYIVVYRPGSLAGMVTDALTGIGIPEATITLSPGNYQGTTISSATGGHRGDYTLGDVPVGTYSAAVSAGGYRTFNGTGITISNGAQTILDIALTPLDVSRKLLITIDPPCGAVGNPVAIAAHAAGGGHLYQYLVNNRSYCETEQRNWEIIQDWTTEPSVIWIPRQLGRHTVVVKAADDIADSCPLTAGASYEVGGTDCFDPVEISLRSATGAVNEPITITAIADDGDVQYSFWANDVPFCDPSQPPNWLLLQDWSFSKSFTFTPEAENIYTFVARTAQDITDPCQGIGGMTYDVSSSLEGDVYWSFNEESGSVVYDTSGYGNDGVVNGATRVPGNCGGGLQFDGTDDYVEIPDHASLDMPNGITLASWIKIAQLPSSGAQTIISKDENGTLNVSSGGTLTGWLTTTTGESFEVSGTTSLSMNTWHHIASTATADGTLTVYVDGIEDGSIPISGEIMTNAASVYIGFHEGVSGRFFKGTLDEVHIRNRALTAEEIQAVMECGVGTLSGYVRDATTGQSIALAKVTVLPGSFDAVTGQSSPFGTTFGKYRITNIPGGTYFVTATKEGYEANAQSSVVVVAGETNSLTISLEPH